MGIDTTDVAAVPAGVAAWEPRVSAGERRTLAVQRRTSAGEPSISAVQPRILAGERRVLAVQPSILAVERSTSAVQPGTSAGEPRLLAVQPRTSAGERRVSAVQRKFSAGELHARAMGSGRRYTSSTLRSALAARWFAYAAYVQPRLAPGKRPQASIEIEERGIRIVVDRQVVAREHRRILRNGLISHDLTKHSRILRL